MGKGVRRWPAAVAVALACLAATAPAFALGAVQPPRAAAAPHAKPHARHHRHAAPVKPRPAVRAPAPAKIAACPDADLSPLPTNTAQVAAAILCLINQMRAQHGVGALLGNAKLAQAAQRHTGDMVASQYLGHDGPAGDTAQSRIRDTGYAAGPSTGYSLGELVDYGLSAQAAPRAMAAKWSSAPEFAATLLDPVYRDAGIGVAASPPAAWANGEPGATFAAEFGAVAPLRQP